MLGGGGVSGGGEQTEDATFETLPRARRYSAAAPTVGSGGLGGDGVGVGGVGRVGGDGGGGLGSGGVGGEEEHSLGTPCCPSIHSQLSSYLALAAMHAGVRGVAHRALENLLQVQWLGPVPDDDGAGNPVQS